MYRIVIAYKQRSKHTPGVWAVKVLSPGLLSDLSPTDINMPKHKVFKSPCS